MEATATLLKNVMGYEHMPGPKETDKTNSIISKSLSLHHGSSTFQVELSERASCSCQDPNSKIGWPAVQFTNVSLPKESQLVASGRMIGSFYHWWGNNMSMSTYEGYEEKLKKDNNFKVSNSDSRLSSSRSRWRDWAVLHELICRYNSKTQREGKGVGPGPKQDTNLNAPNSNFVWPADLGQNSV